MSNHDLTVANGPGINVRQDIEAALQALGSNFQGGAVPLATYPCQMWADSTNGQLKIRNIANTAWVILGALDTQNFGHLSLTGGALAGPGNLTVAGTLGVTGVATFTASPVGPTPAPADSTTKLATTAFVAAAVATGGGAYLPLTGGTMSGNLTINTGAAQAQIALIAPAGQYRALIGLTGAANRWSILLGDNAAESGSNAGTNFIINRFTDAGALIDTVLSISRAGGGTTVQNLTCVNMTASAGISTPGAATVGGVLQTNNSLNVNGVAGTNRTLAGLTSGVLRWVMALGDSTTEAPTAAGSNFSLFSYTNAGAFLGQPLWIARATGIATFSAAIVNGPSDRSLKEDIAPLTGALAKIEALQGVSFSMIGDEAKRRQIGLIAQDVAPVVPEILQDYQSGENAPLLALDYPKLTALLIEAVKELSGKVATLEGGLTR